MSPHKPATIDLRVRVGLTRGLDKEVCEVCGCDPLTLTLTLTAAGDEVCGCGPD